MCVILLALRNSSLAYFCTFIALYPSVHFFGHIIYGRFLLRRQLSKETAIVFILFFTGFVRHASDADSADKFFCSPYILQGAQALLFKTLPHGDDQAKPSFFEGFCSPTCVSLPFFSLLCISFAHVNTFNGQR